MNGKTTSIALALLSKAIEAKGATVFGKDHKETMEGMEALTLALKSISEKNSFSFYIDPNPKTFSVGVRLTFKF